MKFSKSAILVIATATTAFASNGGPNEWDTIESRMAPNPARNHDLYRILNSPAACNPQFLDAKMMIDKVSI